MSPLLSLFKKERKNTLFYQRRESDLPYHPIHIRSSLYIYIYMSIYILLLFLVSSLSVFFSRLLDEAQHDAAHLGLEHGREHDGNDRHELDEDVQRRAGRVLERVADGVTDDGGRVLRGALALVLVLEAALLDVLLRVIPRTARVGGGDGHLHAGHDGTGQHTGERELAEEHTDDDGAQHDERRGRDHLTEGRLRRNRDTALVVGLLAAVRHLGVAELAADLVHHVHRSHADGLHRHGGEPVGQHGAEEQARHHAGVEDVHLRDRHARHVGAVQRERDERRGADREALADGGSRVAGRVERVRDLADLVAHVGHLCNTAGVIRDGAVGVDGERDGHGREDAERSEGVAVEVAHAVGHIDGDAHGEDRRHDGQVAEGEAVDDVRRRARLARLGDLLHRAVRVGREVLRRVANEEAGPEAAEHAHESAPARRLRRADREGGGERELRQEGNHDGGRDGGVEQLALQRGLDVGGALDAVRRRAHRRDDDADQDADGRDEQRVHHGGEGGRELGGAGRNHERGAGRLTEAAKEIGAHTSDIANVVADAVRNDAGVARIVLRDVVLHLADEIGADIGRLGVDAATDAPEAGDRGAAETEGRDALVQLGEVLRQLAKVGADDLHRQEERGEPHGGEAKAHRDAATEGGLEAVGEALGLVALIAAGGRHDGRAGVRVDGNAHADPPGADGGEGARHEGEDGEARARPRRGGRLGALLRGGEGNAEHEVQQRAEARHEDGHVLVLGQQEGGRALGDAGVDHIDVAHHLVGEEAIAQALALPGGDLDVGEHVPPVHGEDEADGGRAEDDDGGDLRRHQRGGAGHNRLADDLAGLRG
ncbi:inorganic pyrophosphatase, partial [Strigomonas culicis]